MNNPNVSPDDALQSMKEIFDTLGETQFRERMTERGLMSPEELATLIEQLKAMP